MRVAIDSGPLTGGHGARGIGVNTRELISALGKNVEVVDFGNADLSKYDIVHYPYFHPFFITLPRVKPSRRVVLTIHDLTQLIYPKHYLPGIKGKLRFIEQKKRLKQVDAIITISETSKKDICRFLKVDPKIVHVTHLAPRKIFKKLNSPKTKLKLPEKFVFYVGDVNYNKNIPTLVAACKTAGIPLVIVGKQAKEIFEKGDFSHPELSHLGGVIVNDVTFLGFVSDDELVGLFSLASVYVQPSYYEGFGLGILDALASGTPVIASRTQAHVEIAEKWVTFFDPKSSQDLVDKMKEVIKGKSTDYSKEVGQKYSWEKTAKATLDVYKKVFKS